MVDGLTNDNYSVRLLIAIVGAMILGSCGTTALEQRRQSLIKKHDWSEKEIAAIKDGDVRKGFTPKQVKAALGEPVKIKRTDKGEKKWVFKEISMKTNSMSVNGHPVGRQTETYWYYVYFENEKVSKTRGIP